LRKDAPKERRGKGKTKKKVSKEAFVLSKKGEPKKGEQKKVGRGEPQTRPWCFTYSLVKETY